jgi:hypothetical protein
MAGNSTNKCLPRFTGAWVGPSAVLTSAENLAPTRIRSLERPPRSESLYRLRYPGCTMGTGSFPEAKRPGRGVNHPPQYSAEIKERVQLYFYCPPGPSWPVLGWTLPLPYDMKFLSSAEEVTEACKHQLIKLHTHLTPGILRNLCN